MVVSRRRKGPKAVQKSNTNLKPELHHTFKHASTIKLLETNTSDRFPVGSKSSNGKRKARSKLNLRVEPEPNTLGNYVSGLTGPGSSKITQKELQIRPSTQFNQGLVLAKPVPTSVKGKKDIARGRAPPLSLGSAAPSKVKTLAPYSSHAEKLPSTFDWSSSVTKIQGDFNGGFQF